MSIGSRTDRSVSVLIPMMTLSDLERRHTRGQILQADLLNEAHTVWPRTTKFGKITWVGEERIYRGQPRPYRKGTVPQRNSVPQLLGFPSVYAYTLWRRTTKFDVITHLGWGLFWPSLFWSVLSPWKYKFNIIKDERLVCQKWKVKLIFRGTFKTVWWLALTDPDPVFELHTSQSMPGPLTSREGPHT